jgi:hypothetical protein
MAIFVNLLLLEVVDFRSHVLAFREGEGEPPSTRKDPINGVIVLLRLQANPYRSGLPRRMPSEKHTQVVGTHLALQSTVNEGY